MESTVCEQEDPEKEYAMISGYHDQRRPITQTPENSETPLEAVCSWVTPTRLFFVRNHFGVPTIDLDQWSLSLDGCVRRPIEVRWDDLQRLPQRNVFATLECAGNGRSFLSPAVDGVQWGAGAIAHAEWTGVPLHLLLEEAGITPDAVEIAFLGADSGQEHDQPDSVQFGRSLPLAKALHEKTLLATRMNGEPLEPNHGFPVRLLVPGWYGVASVKWLTKIRVLDRPFDGYYQTKKYTIRAESPDGLETIPVQSMEVKSEVIFPRAGESLPVGASRVFGVAWAGEERIARVQVSTDGGKTWEDAELLGPQSLYAWTLWEYPWEIATPGQYRLLVRATSASGRTQPLQHDPLRGGYAINFSRPVSVQVDGGPSTRAEPGDPSTMLYDMNAFAEANARVPLDILLEYCDGAGI